MWTVNSTRTFNRWYQNLDDDAKAQVIAVIERLRVAGPLLARPYADTLEGSRHANMKELRTHTATAEIRIAFAFDPERAALLLCAGSKSGVNQRLFYDQLIALADHFFDDHLERIKLKRRKRKGK